jgi:hypothetical protein
VEEDPEGAKDSDADSEKSEPVVPEDEPPSKPLRRTTTAPYVVLFFMLSLLK